MVNYHLEQGSYSFTEFSTWLIPKYHKILWAPRRLFLFAIFGNQSLPVIIILNMGQWPSRRSKIDQNQGDMPLNWSIFATWPKFPHKDILDILRSIFHFISMQALFGTSPELGNDHGFVLAYFPLCGFAYRWRSNIPTQILVKGKNVYKIGQWIVNMFDVGIVWVTTLFQCGTDQAGWVGFSGGCNKLGQKVFLASLTGSRWPWTR